MNLESIESFRVFAKTLNLTKAAALRNLTQPALHKQIKTLGEDLGAELYRKEGRTLKLTEAGIAVAKFSRELGDRIDLLHAALRSGRAHSRVSLAAGRGSYLYLLGPALQEFNREFPGQLNLLTTNKDETLSALRSGEAHLGVTVMEELPADLHSTLLCEVAPHLVVSRHHPLANCETLDLAALDGLPLICPTPPSAMRDIISHRLTAAGLKFNPVLSTTGWDLLMHFASLEMGAAIVNGCCQPPENTVAVRLRDLPLTRYYLVSHPREVMFPELNWLRKRILRESQSTKLF